MEFSSDVLISFGLNITGYLAAAVLVSMLIRRWEYKKTIPVSGEKADAAAPLLMPDKEPEPETNMISDESEFISLSDMRRMQTSAADVNKASASEAVVGPPDRIADRNENRRAIYREARKLLAKGETRDKLLRRLPVTEGELEMLTVAKKA